MVQGPYHFDELTVTVVSLGLDLIRLGFRLISQLIFDLLIMLLENSLALHFNFHEQIRRVSDAVYKTVFKFTSSSDVDI